MHFNRLSQLNILALAFHGLRKSDLHPSIKKKLSRLLEATDQKISFEFEINNEISGEKLVANKINPETDHSSLKALYLTDYQTQKKM